MADATKRNKTALPTPKEVSTEEQFESVFNDLISNNCIRDTVVVKGITFELKTLTTEEFLESENVFIASLNGVPIDVIGRIRLVSNLSYAISKVNNISIENEDKEKERGSRISLYNQLMKFPPGAIDILQDKYRELVKKQDDLLNPKDVIDNIENF